MRSIWFCLDTKHGAIRTETFPNNELDFLGRLDPMLFFLKEPIIKTRLVSLHSIWLVQDYTASASIFLKFRMKKKKKGGMGEWALDKFNIRTEQPAVISIFSLHA